MKTKMTQVPFEVCSKIMEQYRDADVFLNYSGSKLDGEFTIKWYSGFRDTYFEVIDATLSEIKRCY